MNKKAIIIGLIIVFICIFAFLGFYFHDDIQNYFEEESWIYVEPYIGKKIEASNVYIGGTNLFIIRDNNLYIYSKKLDLVSTEAIGTSQVVYDSNGTYTIIASKDKKFMRLYKNEKMLWNKAIDLELQSISLNKNGYIAVIFTQNGYKSGVKLFSNNGDEVLNIYLGSTYAVDAEISSDNKTLYVGEVDFNGINVRSNLKIVDVSTNKSKVVTFDDDELITTVEYADSKHTYIQTNEAIYLLDGEGNTSRIYEYVVKNTVYSSIDSVKLPIVIEKNDNIIRVLKEQEDRFLNIEEEPQMVDSLGNNMAIYVENEVWIINSNCRILKKCKLNNGIIDVKFMNDGKILALIFNDKVELIKV